MHKLIGIIFLVLQFLLIKYLGWLALLWFPIGFLIGLVLASQMILPIILGIPLAVSLISKKEMRPIVLLVLFRAFIIWVILLFIIGFAMLRFWPISVDWAFNNVPLNFGMNLGTLAILLTPLSKSSRVEFRSDFDRSYGCYYTAKYDKFHQNKIDQFS